MEYGHEKPEVTAVSIDPNFSSYLFSEYLCSLSDNKLSEGVYLGRYYFLVFALKLLVPFPLFRELLKLLARRGLREDETRWTFGLPGACEHW